MIKNTSTKNVFNIIVIVAALGYFVDIYDLILFSILRVSSLDIKHGLGLNDDELKNVGLSLLSWQMTGMLIGGLLWGIIGDLKGRVSVLFGSIILYSAANILNGLITDVDQYKWLRLLAGIGLAGELGAGITLVSETMTKERRGFGTTLVVSFGVSGAILAAWVGNNFEWRTAYFIGGGLGLVLLFLRIGVYESGMYKTIKRKGVQAGNFLLLFKKKNTLLKYLSCIGVGLPIWFVVGILIFLSREFAKSFNVSEPVNQGLSVMYCYIGMASGDFVCGLLSQIFKTRKKILVIYLSTTLICVLIYLFQKNISLTFLYFLCFTLGFCAGYWAVFITVASEQFGTNIRSTVTTTVPNFVRGSVALMTIGLEFLENTFQISLIYSALIIGLITLALAFASLFWMKETFGKDLDYVEEFV